jgi:16S rRNA (uracil1498-N3)-methyltransferase
MHRFYLPPGHGDGPELRLEGREARHAAQILRVRPGETVTVLDGVGQEWLCQVSQATEASVQLQVAERKVHPRPAWQVTLAQAIPKARIIEDIIQKATELGVARVVPLLAERVVTHPDRAGLAAKAARWQQTAVEAIKQCGNPWLPQIETPLAPTAFVEKREASDLALIGSLLDAPHPLGERLQDYFLQHHRLPRTVCIWIGPEGDFTPAEVELAKAAGALPISLGPLVLRCETAALYCLAVLQHELSARSAAR